MEKILNYINGTLTEPLSGNFFNNSGNFFNNINPAEGKPYSLIPDSDKADVTNATVAAKKAFAVWSDTPARERSTILIKIADLIDRDYKNC